MRFPAVNFASPIATLRAGACALALGLAACAGGAPEPALAPEPDTPTVTPVPGTATPEPSATPEPTATPAPPPRLPSPPPATAREVARGSPDDPRVALTFDCGSVAGPSAGILDTLKRYGLRVTFFMTGQYAEKYPDLVRRMAAEGHELANHSATHADFTKLTDQQIRDELAYTEQLVVQLTGKSTKPWMRMPFGARNERVWNVVAAEGYVSVFWTLDSGDWLADATTASVRTRVLERTTNGAIVVHHCAAPQTAEALPAIIEGLQAKGHRIVMVSELLGRAPAAGRVVDGNDLLAPVNKRNSLSPTYTPPDLVEVPAPPAVRAGIRLRKAAWDAVQALAAEARAQGLRLAVISGYRSYQDQEALYRGYVASMGEERAAQISARPGHSEHQLGTAVDFGSPANGYQLEEDFADTAEGRWLLANAGRFGFVLSYPRSGQAATGYAYEPWHFRYVGVEQARAVAASGLTLTEYLERR